MDEYPSLRGVRVFVVFGIYGEYYEKCSERGSAEYYFRATI